MDAKNFPPATRSAIRPGSPGYHDPKVAPSGRRYIDVTDYVSTDSELSAVYRAKRALVRVGWAVGDAGCQLDPLPNPPAAAGNCSPCAVSVQSRDICPKSEHLTKGAVSIQNVPESVNSEHLNPCGVSVPDDGDTYTLCSPDESVTARDDTDYEDLRGWTVSLYRHATDCTCHCWWYGDTPT